MNVKTKAIAIESEALRIGFWALLALLILMASTGCGETPQPAKESDQNHGDVGVSNEAPPTTTAEVITVDLNAVELDAKKQSEAKSCRDLHGPLLQIVESKEPVQEARALGLNVREDKVQITLVLNTQDAAFLRQSGIDTGKRTGKQIQVYAPILRLCELAADKRVDAVYPVSQAETQ